MAKSTVRQKRAVVVTTQHRGVFFGYLEGQKGKVVTLSQVRNCTYWDAALHGFIGLATDGPNERCKIGPAASNGTLFDVTAILDVTQAAVDRWETAPWS